MGAMILRTRGVAGVGAAESLAAAAPFLGTGGGQAAVLLYSAEQCLLGRLEPEGTVLVETRRIDLAGFFEVRAFGARGELRWLDDGSGQGRAAYISEEEAGPFTPIREDEVLKSLPGSYLVWGEPAGAAAAGWTRLTSGRIGQVIVPLEVPPRSRARIEVVEYLRVGEDGNAEVFEERLTGLGVANG